MDKKNLTIAEARKLLDEGRITSLELVDYFLARIDRYNQVVKACLSFNGELAREQARQADQRLAAGERGGLLGIPYLVKDNILVKEEKATAASKMLADYIAPYNATVIEKLQKAGSVFLGKTNLDEFAHGSSTENSAFFTTHNPYDLDKVPGGSSGGSAAAVASDFCLFALGSDTGGSVRHPASFCGVVGYKPSYGSLSRHGLMAMTSSTDVIGVIAKTAQDAKEVMAIIAGGDNYDPTAQTEIIPSMGIGDDFSGLTIGWPKEYFTEGLNPEVRASLNKIKEIMEERGAKFIEISLPSTKYGVAVYSVITPAEVSSNLARFDGLRYGYKKAEQGDEAYLLNRGGGFGPEAKRRIMLGTYVLSAGEGHSYYDQAQKVRQWMKADFNQAFKTVDYILTPTVPSTAFNIGEKNNNPLSLYLEDSLLTPASLAGLPAVSIPSGLDSNNLPIGSQLIGKRGDDFNLLDLADSLRGILSFSRPNFSWE